MELNDAKYVIIIAKLGTSSTFTDNIISVKTQTIKLSSRFDHGINSIDYNRI